MDWHAVAHWINVEYWSVSWPNVFAPSFWTLLGMTLNHIHMTRLQRQHHESLVKLLKDKI